MKIILTLTIVLCYYIINKFSDKDRIGNVSDAKWVIKRMKKGKDI
jgi:hypothetical protein